MLNFILKKGKKIFSILLISNHIKQNKAWKKKKKKKKKPKKKKKKKKKTLILSFKSETKIIKGNSSFYI